MINNKDISASHARVLSKIGDEEVVNTLANKVANEKLTVRELEEISSSDMSIPKRKPMTRQSIKVNKYGIYENSLKEKLGVCVNVTDNKIVIPFNGEEDLNRIFERFYREDKARNVEGNGLGLAIVKSIVDLHHGKIDILSQVDVGTNFIVRLPIEKQKLIERLKR